MQDMFAQSLGAARLTHEVMHVLGIGEKSRALLERTVGGNGIQ